MSDKRIVVLIHGADRLLWAGSPATVTFAEMNKTPIVVMKEQTVSGAVVQLDLQGVHFDAAQLYALRVTASGHRAAWQLISQATFFRQQGGVQVEHDEAILRMMLVPNRPQASSLPGGFQRLVDAGSALAHSWSLDAAGYAALPAANQMALLNLAAKLQETWIADQVPLMSYVSGLRAVEPDRLFILVRPELKQMVRRSTDFAGAPGHDKPPDHQDFPDHPDSWKHQGFPGGNIQLSFSRATEPWPAGSATAAYSVDVDIDLARGMDHGLEWLSNNFFSPGQKTDQTQVYMLLFGQGILPVYTLDEPAAKAKRKAKRVGS